MAELKVTSIEEIKKRSERIIELPGWDEGEPLFVRVKSGVSLTGLIQSGVIPNSLMAIVQKTVLGEDIDYKDAEKDPVEEGKKMFELIEIVCAQTLIEPLYDEIKEHLTDKQKTALFIYAQGGLKSLESFRERQRPATKSSGNGKRVQPKAK